MKKYDICVKKTYTKDGEEKTMWNRVGRMVYFAPTQDKQGGFRLEIDLLPQLFVFEQKPKEVAPVAPRATSSPADGSDPINPDEIPF